MKIGTKSVLFGAHQFLISSLVCCRCVDQVVRYFNAVHRILQRQTQPVLGLGTSRSLGIDLPSDALGVLLRPRHRLLGKS
jgi:hypothetical protein